MTVLADKELYAESLGGAPAQPARNIVSIKKEHLSILFLGHQCKER